MGTNVGLFTSLQTQPCTRFRREMRPCTAGRPPKLYRCCASANGSGPALSFHVGETTVSFPFQTTDAKQLNQSFDKLLETLAAKQKAERPKRWDLMEYKFKGTGDSAQIEFLEVLCNPNACSSAFDAKVLITLRVAGGVKVTTEARLSNVKADIDSFLEQCV